MVAYSEDPNFEDCAADKVDERLEALNREAQEPVRGYMAKCQMPADGPRPRTCPVCRLGPCQHAAPVQPQRKPGDLPIYARLLMLERSLDDILGQVNVLRTTIGLLKDEMRGSPNA